MDDTIGYYTPSEKPTDIPPNYRPCEHLGKEAKIAFMGKAITCTANCQYDHKSNMGINWEEEGNFRAICKTKGLVHKSEQPLFGTRTRASA